MNKEKALGIINTEMERWERMKELVNAFEKGKIYKIWFQYLERKLKDPNNWRSAYWVKHESVFIGTLKEYNKTSINFEVLTVKDVEKSNFRYKLSAHKNNIDFNLKNLDTLNSRGILNEQDRKDIKRYTIGANKKFHASIKLDSFLRWEEWVPNNTEAPLMVNYEFMSESMRKQMFGV